MGRGQVYFRAPASAQVQAGRVLHYCFLHRQRSLYIIKTTCGGKLVDELKKMSNYFATQDLKGKKNIVKEFTFDLT